MSADRAWIDDAVLACLGRIEAQVPADLTAGERADRFLRLLEDLGAALNGYAEDLASIPRDVRAQVRRVA